MKVAFGSAVVPSVTDGEPVGETTEEVIVVVFEIETPVEKIWAMGPGFGDGPKTSSLCKPRCWVVRVVINVDSLAVKTDWTVMARNCGYLQTHPRLRKAAPSRTLGFPR